MRVSKLQAVIFNKIRTQRVKLNKPAEYFNSVERLTIIKIDEKATDPTRQEKGRQDQPDKKEQVSHLDKAYRLNQSNHLPVGACSTK